MTADSLLPAIQAEFPPIGLRLRKQRTSACERRSGRQLTEPTRSVIMQEMMKTSILTPKELFQKDVRYTIPPFQRPYVWKSEEQWEPLWEDVRNLAEDYLDELKRADNDRVAAERETRSHFLGAVILKQVLTAARDIEEREVVDGQQRVTTLQLLLNAVQQTCQDLDLKQPAKRLSKLVTNDEDLSPNKIISSSSGQPVSTRRHLDMRWAMVDMMSMTSKIRSLSRHTSSSERRFGTGLNIV